MHINIGKCSQKPKSVKITNQVMGYSAAVYGQNVNCITIRAGITVEQHIQILRNNYVKLNIILLISTYYLMIM